MEKPIYYSDRESDTILIFSNDIQVIPAGKNLSPSYPGCEVTAHDRILTEVYDLHFSFHKGLPQFSFYPVPQLIIFAIDSLGGSFCPTNVDVNLQDDTRADIYYLDYKQQVHWLAGNLASFLSLVLFQPHWKEALELPGYSRPQASEQAKSFLVNAYNVSETPQFFAPATETILLFPSLAAAQESLPFVDPF